MTSITSEPGGPGSHTDSAQPSQRASDSDAQLGTQTTTGARQGGPRAFLHRLHVVAGIFIAPFLIVAAITGLAYAVAPTLEKVVYHDELTATSHAPAQSVEKQIEAAQAVHPDLSVLQVQLSEDPERTTRVAFADDTLKSESYRHAVFVDPGDLSIKGDLVEYGSSGALPLRSWLSEGHRRLWMGDPGRIYSELAASWMGALALGGLWLWWDRSRRRKQRESAKPASPRMKQMAKHATLGTWLTVGLLFLTATGLTWSMVAGENISTLREQMSWTAPKANTELADATTSAAPLYEADSVAEVARAQGLAGPMNVYLPEEPGAAWLVKEARTEWRTDMNAVSVDGATGRVVDYVPFSDWSLPAKLAEWGINAHMGILFGIVNQLVLVVLAVGIILIAIRGYVMWFLRGKRDSLKPGRLPGPTRWRDVKPTVLIILFVAIAAYAVVAPLFGISLVAFVVVDLLIRAMKSRQATSQQATS
ncbi:PepSY-associated TM helix domain-containing protein [Corynebacterium sp. H78]|uniref:PepSY-associated TM helix domain-containing protein n=1 Tax=Corynebacterium sp. H78 TaxID=3133417 RepID=UPI0030953650